MPRIGVITFVGLLFLVGTTVTLALPESPQDQPRQRSQTEFSTDGTASLSIQLDDGTQIHVSAKQAKYSPEIFPYTCSVPRIEWAGWGTVGLRPSTVITAIDVQINNEYVLVNLSAFSDLADAHTLVLEDISGGFNYRSQGRVHHVDFSHAYRLLIFGSDAAGSYQAELIFNKRSLERRKVVCGEFQENIREETIYTSIPVEGGY
jgi:hypothetical protein